MSKKSKKKKCSASELSSARWEVVEALRAHLLAASADLEEQRKGIAATEVRIRALAEAAGIAERAATLGDVSDSDK